MDRRYRQARVAVEAMKPDVAHQVADALECAPDFLPLLPELLADLEEIGGSRREIVDLLRPLDLPRGARVLDLGCGKGAVLLALVEELGLHGVGVDAFPPFIEAAHSRGFDHRCTFRCGDLHEVARDIGEFQVAMMIALGIAIGEQQEIVRLLRQWVPPGGYMVVDDAFLPDALSAPIPEYDGYADHETTLARLRAHGDKILQEDQIICFSGGEIGHGARNQLFRGISSIAKNIEKAHTSTFIDVDVACQ